VRSINTNILWKSKSKNTAALHSAAGDRRRADHKDFYCPNGHSVIYKGETDAQKLARITQQKNTEIEFLREQLRAKDRKKGRE
jgi:hypothetical protein